MEFDRERKESSKKKRSFPRFQRKKENLGQRREVRALEKSAEGRGGEKKKTPKLLVTEKGEPPLHTG